MKRIEVKVGDLVFHQNHLPKALHYFVNFELIASETPKENLFRNKKLIRVIAVKSVVRKYAIPDSDDGTDYIDPRPIVEDRPTQLIRLEDFPDDWFLAEYFCTQEQFQARYHKYCLDGLRLS